MMMASKNKNVNYKNSFDCIRKLYRDEGIKGYFRGNASNCMRSISGASCLILFDEF